MLGLTRRNMDTPIRRDSEPNIARWDNWGDFTSLRQQMDELFDRFAGTTPSLLGAGYRFVPAVDLYETPEEFVLLCHLPGMTMEGIHVQATGDGIAISGERKSPIPEGEGIAVHRVQGGYGQFNIAYTLPVAIQPDGVTASYENGVLELHLPKVEAARPKPVTVQVKGK